MKLEVNISHKSFHILIAIKTVCTLLLLLTPLSILILYADWSAIKFGWSGVGLFFDTFNKWPWIRMSIILTIITTLSAYSLMWLTRNEHSFEQRFEIEGYAAVYTVLCMPWILLLHYPGHQELGLSYDAKGGHAMLLISVIHGVAFWLIVLRLNSTLLNMVLIFERNKDLCKTLSDALYRKYQGLVQVKTAFTKQQALSILDEHVESMNLFVIGLYHKRIDYLKFYQYSEMDRYPFLRLIRQNHPKLLVLVIDGGLRGGKERPVIENDLKHMIGSNLADSYLLRPFQVEEFLALVQMLLNIRTD